MRMLLAVNDTPYGSRALSVGALLAQRAASAVDILLVAAGDEGIGLQARQTAADLEAAGIAVTLQPRAGRLAHETVCQARTVPYDLVVVGSRGRRGLNRLLLGSLALHVVAHCPASVLVVKGAARSFDRFLICSAAGPSSEHVIRFAGHLARALAASATVLHVMSQLPLCETAATDDLLAPAEELIRRRSPEGVHLERMVRLLHGVGVEARALVRHGLVLDEIVAEAREGQHDLLAVGAHTTPIGEALLEDLAADILLAVRSSVLVVR